jgi:hypothetical protein
VHFEIIGEIGDIETIAVGSQVRDIMRLAELHWYEAQGIRQKKMKIKRFLD